MAKTFHYGGTHPPDLKLTSGCQVVTAPIPPEVTIPLTQHLGAPASSLVSKGDKVLVGQIIGKAGGFVSSNIHSSVSGTVSRVDDFADSSGYKQLSVKIAVEGDAWIDTIDRSKDLKPDIEYTGEEIIGRCSDAGIVGLGGAAFPTQVKLKIPPGRKCDILIINGAECEPYLTSDHRLMIEKGSGIIVGIRLLMKALNTEKAIIGIENNKPDAIEKMTLLAKETKGISVQALEVKYPQGGEKQLIKTILGKEVPVGALPIDLGVVVQNVATAFAVYEAVQKNKPLFERVITVTGKSLSKPSNFLARIGTPVSFLIEAAGGLPGDAGKIINGGPMMGKAVSTADVPVVKSMSGILVLTNSESVRRNVEPCIRCAKCVSACALKLEPYLLMSLSKKGLFEKASEERITDCCECGSCSFICPASRPLLDYIRLGKATVLKMNREKNQKKAETI